MRVLKRNQYHDKFFNTITRLLCLKGNPNVGTWEGTMMEPWYIDYYCSKYEKND